MIFHKLIKSIPKGNYQQMLKLNIKISIWGKTQVLLIEVEKNGNV